jgi:hypothetical protein
VVHKLPYDFSRKKLVFGKSKSCETTKGRNTHISHIMNSVKTAVAAVENAASLQSKCIQNLHDQDETTVQERTQCKQNKPALE